MDEEEDVGFLGGMGRKIEDSKYRIEMYGDFESEGGLFG